MLRRLIEGHSFSPEDITAMVEAYEAVRRELHDRGQPAVVNEVIAKRIIELAKLKSLNSQEMASRVLASLGLQSEK